MFSRDRRPLSLRRHGCCFCFSYVLADRDGQGFGRFGRASRRALMLKTCGVLKSRNTDPWLDVTAPSFPLKTCSVNNTAFKGKKEKGFRVQGRTFHWACS